MAKVQKSGEKSGSNTGMLLVVLVVLIGLSAWNYQRNLALERAVVPTPYAGLSVADLDALIAAYQSEIDTLRAQGGADRRASARPTSGVAQGVREFERVQRSARSAREAGYRISEREGALRALEEERSRRSQQTKGVALFLRRAFSVSF